MVAAVAKVGVELAQSSLAEWRNPGADQTTPRPDEASRGNLPLDKRQYLLVGPEECFQAEKKVGSLTSKRHGPPSRGTWSLFGCMFHAPRPVGLSAEECLPEWHVFARLIHVPLEGHTFRVSTLT